MRTRLATVGVMAAVTAVLLSGCGLTDPKMNPPEPGAGSTQSPADVNAPAPTGQEFTFKSAAQQRFIQGFQSQYVKTITGPVRVRITMPTKDGKSVRDSEVIMVGEFARESTTENGKTFVTIMNTAEGVGCIRDVSVEHPDTPEGDLSAKWECEKSEPVMALAVQNHMARSSPMDILDVYAQKTPAMVNGTNNPLSLKIELKTAEGEPNGSLSYQIANGELVVTDTLPDGKTGLMKITSAEGYQPPTWSDLDKKMNYAPLPEPTVVPQR